MYKCEARTVDDPIAFDPQNVEIAGELRIAPNLFRRRITLCRPLDDR